MKTILIRGKKARDICGRDAERAVHSYRFFIVATKQRLEYNSIWAVHLCGFERLRSTCTSLTVGIVLITPPLAGVQFPVKHSAHAAADFLVVVGYCACVSLERQRADTPKISCIQSTVRSTSVRVVCFSQKRRSGWSSAPHHSEYKDNAQDPATGCGMSTRTSKTLWLPQSPKAMFALGGCGRTVIQPVPHQR